MITFAGGLYWGLSINNSRKQFVIDKFYSGNWDNPGPDKVDKVKKK
jgi:hypothetical protein